MFEVALNLITRSGKTKSTLPTGNRMWEIAARSNARPKVVKLNGKIINGEQNEQC